MSSHFRPSVTATLVIGLRLGIISGQHDLGNAERMLLRFRLEPPRGARELQRRIVYAMQLAGRKE